MIILDTNILSELMRTQANKLVLGWIATHKATDLFITALTKAEILGNSKRLYKVLPKQEFDFH